MYLMVLKIDANLNKEKFIVDYLAVLHENNVEK